MLGLLLFVLYALGASRTIYVGDSGELVAAVHTLGIPHPTGYPLYVLLGKLWTLLVPVGSIAFRMSLISAACAARRGRRPLRAGALARPRSRSPRSSRRSCSPSRRASGPRPTSSASTRSTRCSWSAALAAGASLAPRSRAGRVRAHLLPRRPGRHQPHLHGVLRVAFGVSAVVREPARPAPRCGCSPPPPSPPSLGLLVYAYLPLRSRMDPALDWGNPETLSGFLDVVLRRGFWQRRFWEGRPTSSPSVGDYLRGTRHRAVLGGRPLSRSPASSVARRRGWPIVLLLADRRRQPRQHGDARLAQRPLHLAPLLHPVLRRDGAASPGSAARRWSSGCPMLGCGCGARLARVLPLALPLVMLVVGYPAVRPQPLPHRRGLQPLAARDAAARRAPDGERRQHPVRPHLPEPGREACGPTSTW